jgi:hypothetical protein
MADAPVVHIGENSPEYVAFMLMDRVNAAEKHPTQTRRQILDLYAECLLAVTQPHRRPPGTDKTVAHFR